MVDTFTYMKTIALEIATMWFVAWGIRKKYELDEKLNRRAWIIRIIVVVIGFCSLFFRTPSFMYVRIVCMAAATAMILWPNFASRISNSLGDKNQNPGTDGT